MIETSQLITLTVCCGYVSNLIGRRTINIPEIILGVHGLMGFTVNSCLMTNLLHRFKSKAHKRCKLYKCFDYTLFKLSIIDDTHHGVVIFLQMPFNTLNKTP